MVVLCPVRGLAVLKATLYTYNLQLKGKQGREHKRESIAS